MIDEESVLGSRLGTEMAGKIPVMSSTMTEALLGLAQEERGTALGGF